MGEEHIGTHVVYHDEYGKPHDAIVTAVWDSDAAPETHHWPNCSINLVMVSKDEDKRDQYGRQIERWTSVMGQQHQTAHGRYWRLP